MNTENTNTATFAEASELIQVSIEIAQAGMRLDKAITELTELSRNHVGQLFELGLISSKNISKLKPSYIVKEGDQITVRLPVIQLPKQIEQVSKQTGKLNIIFEDEYIIVVNKPAGQVVHPSAGHLDGTLVDDLIAYGPKLSTFSNRPGIVHRLDKDTSGLMLIAKTDLVHNALQEQFANRKITKVYLAKVKNIENLPEHFYLECKVGPHDSKHQLMKAYKQKLYKELPEKYTDTINSMHSGIISKHNEAFFNLLDNDNNIIIKEAENNNYLSQEILEQKKTVYKYAFLECVKYGMKNPGKSQANNTDILFCYPHTGRQHQIRVQLQAAQSPIFGDILYYPKSKNENSVSNNSILLPNRLYLHSFAISFFHPIKKTYITVSSKQSSFI